MSILKMGEDMITEIIFMLFHQKKYSGGFFENYNKQMKEIKKMKNALIKLNKSSKRLAKAKANRIWIENNPKIHLLNYPYYKLKELVK